MQNILFSGYITSFLILFVANPGIPGRNHFKEEYFKNYKGKLSLLQLCGKCNILMPKEYKCGHCGYCNICIIGYDHHCPWVGKCIGKYNFIIFYFFLILLTIFLLNGMVLFVLFLKNNHFLFFK